VVSAWATAASVRSAPATSSPAPAEMPRDELIVLVGEQAERIAAQDRQITTLATRIADMDEAYAALTAKLARVEHLLSRNSGIPPQPAVHGRPAG